MSRVSWCCGFGAGGGLGCGGFWFKMHGASGPVGVPYFVIVRVHTCQVLDNE